MSLAAILGFLLFSFNSMASPEQRNAQPPAIASSETSIQQSQTGASKPDTQSPPAQTSVMSPQAPSTNQPTSTPSQATPPAPKRRRHKKPDPNCSNVPAGANAVQSNPSNPENSAAAAPPKPCPTPKKVVRNGGSNEPSIELVGGGATGSGAQQRTIDQLTAATTENLKKLEGRQLNPTQQDMISQIKQFMDQSKTAVAVGDLERGNNLAMKARLLSDELVKP